MDVETKLGAPEIRGICRLRSHRQQLAVLNFLAGRLTGKGMLMLLERTNVHSSSKGSFWNLMPSRLFTLRCPAGVSTVQMGLSFCPPSKCGMGKVSLESAEMLCNFSMALD